MTTALTGGCFCGAIRYESTAEPVIAVHCQCLHCQKFSGTGHSSHFMVPEAAVTLTGTAKSYDAKADSGNMVGRAFCPTCGTPVYSTNSGFPDALFFRAASLDDPTLFKPRLVVYTARAQPWDTVPDDLPGFAEMPPEIPGP